MLRRSIHELETNRCFADIFVANSLKLELEVGRILVCKVSDVESGGSFILFWKNDCGFFIDEIFNVSGIHTEGVRAIFIIQK